MMMSRLSILPSAAITTLLLAALLCGLAACNRNSHADSSSGTNFSTSTATFKGSVGNACALVTKAEAEAVYGEPLAPIHVELMGGDQCQYAPVSDVANSPRRLTVDLDPVVSPGTSMSESEAWKNTKAIDKGMKDALPSAGLGEDSYFTESLVSKGDQLRVLAKHRVVSIEVRGLKDPATTRDVEKKLMQAALSRL